MARLEQMALVAKVLGVNPQTVRKGLEQGVYPFGCAVQCNKGYSYQFFPQKVKECLGIDLRGSSDETQDD